MCLHTVEHESDSYGVRVANDNQKPGAPEWMTCQFPDCTNLATQPDYTHYPYHKGGGIEMV